MGINLSNFLASKSHDRKMGQYQDLDHLDGLAVSSVSANLYNSKRDDLAMFYFRDGANFASLYTQSKILSENIKWNLSQKTQKIFSLVVNTRNANSFTGEHGYKSMQHLADLISKQLTEKQKEDEDDPKIIKPKTVLEIGTYTGYSTICLSEGLDKNGNIHTIDHNEELLVIQNKYFKKAGISKKVKQYTGDATKIVKKLNLDFDLVFIDADKENYPLYFDSIIEKVKPGGVIIADNILWSGKILEKVEEEDYATKSIIEFNDKVNNDDRVETIILPIRDGLSLIIKI